MRLIVFAGGDWAWYGTRYLYWGEKLTIFDLIDVQAHGPSWPMDPRENARAWLELGVPPDLNSWRASIEAARLLCAAK